MLLLWLDTVLLIKWSSQCLFDSSSEDRQLLWSLEAEGKTMVRRALGSWIAADCQLMRSQIESSKSCRNRLRGKLAGYLLNRNRTMEEQWERHLFCLTLSIVSLTAVVWMCTTYYSEHLLRLTLSQSWHYCPQWTTPWSRTARHTTTGSSSFTAVHTDYWTSRLWCHHRTHFTLLHEHCTHWNDSDIRNWWELSWIDFAIIIIFASALFDCVAHAWEWYLRKITTRKDSYLKLPQSADKRQEQVQEEPGSVRLWEPC